MKENRYDDNDFFSQYSKMPRSVGGLQSAGEWHEFQKLLPNIEGKSVLDLGCGYGWHCRYAVEQGAQSVIGIDLSEKMLKEAKDRTNDERIVYMRGAIEDINFDKESFDLIISSLAFHYIKSFELISEKLFQILKHKGDLVFSVEHPVFTAFGNQDWIYDEKGNKIHWPVDNYFIEGRREATFLGKKIIKYHRTLTTYINSLINNGFTIKKVIEPLPSQEMLRENEALKEEFRRPMMLIISAYKD
ncbi:MAG: class I SAM-dependent methyltransferase [Bacteroidota bacterium]|nr:class I SAM-dependent methyltransferase [Bacteroidota bacterium]MDP4197092.1 class I SAM-dependent methyltransferase [Bacteroidota bacterium]